MRNLRPDLYERLYGDDPTAYRTRIPCQLFLELTAPVDLRLAILAEAGTFDILRSAEWEDLPMLQIDPELGQMIGHEGRHRIAAMQNSGGKEAEVVIELISLRIAMRMDLDEIHAWSWEGPLPDPAKLKPEEPINEIARRAGYL